MQMSGKSFFVEYTHSDDPQPRCLFLVAASPEQAQHCVAQLGCAPALPPLLARRSPSVTSA
jgi:hypothetical protein